MSVKNEDVGRPTARDLLEEVGGEQHALHTVVKRGRTGKGSFLLTCSCGSRFAAPKTDANKEALRNVPDEDDES